MKRYRSWRYMCEHCGKTGACGGHMKKHEQRCTMNPERHCGMCEMFGEIQKPMAELIAAFGDGGEDGLRRLQEACFDCPACTLAAMRQSGVMDRTDEDGVPNWHAEWNSFDFEQGCKDAFEAYHQGRQEYY